MNGSINQSDTESESYSPKHDTMSHSSQLLVVAATACKVAYRPNKLRHTDYRLPDTVGMIVESTVVVLVV